MPSDEDSLAKRVHSSFQLLSAAASDLNRVSDELGKSITELDWALKRLNLGVSVWTDIRGSEDPENLDYWSEQIGYAKVSGKWGIALRTVKGNYQWPDRTYVEEWLFNDAPRPLRISAIAKIPALIEELSKEAANNTKKIIAKLAEANEVATAVKAAAEAQLQPSKKVERRTS